MLIAQITDIHLGFDPDNPAELLERFTSLDDMDIQMALKTWLTHSDRVLATIEQARRDFGARFNALKARAEVVDLQDLLKLKRELDRKKRGGR